MQIVLVVFVVLAAVLAWEVYQASLHPWNCYLDQNDLTHDLKGMSRAQADALEGNGFHCYIPE